MLLHPLEEKHSPLLSQISEEVRGLNYFKFVIGESLWDSFLVFISKGFLKRTAGNLSFQVNNYFDRLVGRRELEV